MYVRFAQDIVQGRGTVQLRKAARLVCLRMHISYLCIHAHRAVRFHSVNVYLQTS